MPPMIHCVAENGLTHLLGTRRAHRSVVLVETQAALLERQPAVLEQPANFALRVLDHGFVEHAMNTAGQHGIDVRHESQVVGVVPAEIGKIVGKTLAPGKMLLECREAAAKWMPAGVDDLR